MADDLLLTRLSTQLTQVNDWLKFAESKNAGIVGLASGGITVLVAAVGFLRDAGLGGVTGVALVLAGLLLALSLLIGVWSFLPATSMPAWMRYQVGSPSNEDNLFFYGHIARYDPAGLADAVARRYLLQDPPVIRRVHVDLAAQIVINARITLEKLRLYRWSVLLFAAGILLAAAVILFVLL